MTNQEILEKAITKAIKGGWTFPWGQEYFRPKLDVVDNPDFGPSIWNHGEYEDWDEVTWQEIIFSHDFAKALWGELRHQLHGIDDPIQGPGYSVTFLPDWQYHLQQMVIADDPLAYLGENL